MAEGGRRTHEETAAGRAAEGGDAIELLTQDHRQVERLFKRFEEAPNESARAAAAERICLMLKVHTQIEEEIFYPAAKGAIEDRELVDEAIVEHRAASDLIEEIESTEPGEEMFIVHVEMLSEQVSHHIQGEETELFPEVRRSRLDLAALGAKLAARKAELLRELGADTEIPEEPRSFEPPRGKPKKK